VLLLLLLLLLSTSGRLAQAAFDLNAVRLATSPSAASAFAAPLAGFSEWYGRFVTPLPLELAPLCGNGVLDNATAYDAFYAANPGVFLRLDSRHNVTFSINEVCDDGNRLDGDGCAADCAAMDAMVGPCELAPVYGGLLLAPAEAYEFLEFLLLDTAGNNNNATTVLLLVVTTQRIFLADPATLALTSTVVASKNFTATTGFADHDRVWLLDAGTGVLWVLARAQAWAPAVWNHAPTMAGRRRFEWLPLVIFGVDHGLLLLCVDTMHLLNVRDRTATAMTALAQVPGPPPGDPNTTRVAQFDVVQFTPPYQISCMMGTMHAATFLLSSAMVVSGGTPWVYTNPFFAVSASMGVGPWLGFFMSVFMPMHSQSVTSLVSELRYRSPQFGQHYEGEFGPMRATELTPFAFYTTLPSVRSELNQAASQKWIDGVGEPLARSAGSVRAPMVCAGSAPCLLDMPVCASALPPQPQQQGAGNNMYAGVANPDQTFYTALAAAAAALPSSASWDDIVRAAVPHLTCPSPTTTTTSGSSSTTVIQQQLRHPVTEALWLVRAGALYEVGRRGTQALLPVVQEQEQQQRCVPSYSGACAAGAWSPPRLACRPCAQAPSSSSPDALVAWQQRCGGGGSVVGGRRLLQQRDDVVALVLVSTTLGTVNAAAQFLLNALLGGGLAVVDLRVSCTPAPAGGPWTFACNCTLDIPQTAASSTSYNSSALVLRALAASVANRTDTAFLGTPRVTTLLTTQLSTTPAPGGGDPAPVLTFGVIMGLSVGGGVLLVAALCAAVWCCSCCSGASSSSLHGGGGSSPSYTPLPTSASAAAGGAKA